MARLTTLELIPPAFVVSGEPIGDPVGATGLAIQRALNTLNNCAYRSRSVLFAWQDFAAPVSFTVPVSTSGVLWEWQAHIHEGIATLQIGVRWLLTAGGGDVVFQLRRNGSAIATLTPTASGVYQTDAATSSSIASGDATFDIYAGGGAAGAGTLSLRNVWVCYSNQTIP